MLDAPLARVHSLALRRDDRGVFCGPEGLFVGSVPLLDSEPASASKRRFSPRPLAELKRDLQHCYGLPVDATAKIDGIGAVARALNDGDLARACIAAVFLSLPEIPEHSPQALMKCATALAESGLLKASPDDPEHPGYPAGTPGGKGGQFRPKSELVDLTEEEGGFHGGHTIREHVNRSREYLMRVAENSKWQFGTRRGWQDRVGSFPSLAAANKLVNSTLAQNASIVDEVATGRVDHATAQSWFGSPTGYESYKPSFGSQATIRDTFGVLVVMKHDPRSSRGFRIITAYPNNPEE